MAVRVPRLMRMIMVVMAELGIVVAAPARHKQCG